MAVMMAGSYRFVSAVCVPGLSWMQLVVLSASLEVGSTIPILYKLKQAPEDHTVSKQFEFEYNWIWLQSPYHNSR